MPSYTQGLDMTLPEGIYDFVVADAERQAEPERQRYDRAAADHQGAGMGRKSRFMTIWFSRPRRSGKSTCSASARATSSSAGQSVEFDATDCLDRTGKCSVIVDKFEGRERNKVGEYLDPAAIDNSQTPQQTANARKPASPPAADDDIPVY